MTIKNDQHGLPVQAGRPALSQTIAIGAGSIQSAPFSMAVAPGGSYTLTGSPMTSPNQTMHVRLVATSDCWIAFGANPTAVASGTASVLLPAGVPEYFWVYPGERVAAIQSSAGGSLNIAEMQA